MIGEGPCCTHSRNFVDISSDIVSCYSAPGELLAAATGQMSGVRTGQVVSLLLGGLVSVASIVITTVIQVIVFKAMAKLSLLSSKSSILSIKSSLLSFLSPSPAPSFSYYSGPLLPAQLQSINNIPISYPNYHFHRHDHYLQVSVLLSTIINHQPHKYFERNIFAGSSKPL